MKTILRAASVVAMISGVAGGNVVRGQKNGSPVSPGEIARVTETVKRKDLIPELEREILRLMTEGEVPGLEIAVVHGGRSTGSRALGLRMPRRAGR
jgi:hypothetical protein